MSLSFQREDQGERLKRNLVKIHIIDDTVFLKIRIVKFKGILLFTESSPDKSKKKISDLYSFTEFIYRLLCLSKTVSGYTPYNENRILSISI